MNLSNDNKTKKIPIRKCLGCNEEMEKRQLIRIVRSPEGEISIDKTSKKSGRGAYICHNLNCLKKVRKSKRLENALNCAIPDEVYEKLEKELKEDD